MFFGPKKTFEIKRHCSSEQRWANSGLAQTKKFWSGKNPDQNENLVWIDENEIEWSSDIFQSIAIQF